MPAQPSLDRLRSLWDVIAGELRRQIYLHSTNPAEVAKLLDVDRSTVSRLINGKLHLRPDHAAVLDAAWKLDGLLFYLVSHASARPEDNWLPALSQYEADASRHRQWSVTVVPGLWQTPEYARACFQEAYKARTLDDVDEAMETRLARQVAVWDRPVPPRIAAIISWSVLRYRVGTDEVMRAQLAHIRDLCDRPGVSLRIVPERAGIHVGHDGDFKILTVGTAEVSYAETAGMLGALHLEAEKVEGYARRWDRLSDLAWPLDESLGWIDNEMSAYG